MNAYHSLAGWMVYTVCLSALLGLLAAAVEETIRRSGLSVRALWGASLSAALLLPLLVWAAVRGPVAPSVVADVPATVQAAVASATVAAPDPVAPSVTRSSAMWAALATWRDALRVPNLVRFDGAARVIALASSLAYVLWLVAAWMSLRAQRRGWHEGTVDGTAVLVSGDFGPAIVGLRHPMIVVPEWAMGLTVSEQRLMIAHEREHLAAHDGRTVTLALGAIAFMPWNVALWRLVRRVRLGVELDCDARLLAARHDVREYGELLLEVARHTPTGSAMVAALVERPSALRRRIEAMTARGRGASLGRAMRDLSVVALAVAAACMIAPPRAEMGAVAPQAFAQERVAATVGQRSLAPLSPTDSRPAQGAVAADSGAIQQAAVAVAVADSEPNTASAAGSGAMTSDVLRGIVSAADGTPIENALVKATGQLSGTTTSTHTNARGQYTMFIVSGEGDYRLAFSADGYNDTTGAVKRSAPEQVLVGNITLTKSQGAAGAGSRQDASAAAPQYPLPGSTDILRGRVVAPDGTPIENAAVVATNRANGVKTSTRTNSAGRYTMFIANGDGNYLMAFAADSYNDTTVVLKRDADEDVLVADMAMTKSANPLPAAQTAPMSGELRYMTAAGRSPWVRGVSAEDRRR